MTTQTARPRTRHIIYACTAHGYTVQLLAGDEVVEAYSFGNHSNDSTATVPLHSPNALNIRTIRRFAMKTAYELGGEKNIPIESIEYDDDLEDALEELDGSSSL
jgi:hypothetical protein